MSNNDLLWVIAVEVGILVLFVVIIPMLKRLG